jgi:4-carboxymuconolactone decarboxylase
MSRLKTLGREDLDERQRAMWDSVLAGRRGAHLHDPPSSLAGPFNAWLYSPVAGRRAGELGEELRFRISIPDHLKELAVVAAGARWRSEFEFFAHSRLARKLGIPDSVIDALRDGRRPTFEDEDQAAVYDLVQPLLSDGFVGEDAYANAQKRFGDRGVVELVMLACYYTMVSLTINAFAVPLPPGVDRSWPSSAS